MNWTRTLMKLLTRIPPTQRRQFKALYEHLPRFGRRTHYSERGEDAFLQGYFGQNISLTSFEVIALPSYLRQNVGRGFYVDVGANAPIWYSNTHWFYQRGWRGINIDAAPGSMKAFDKIRPRDLNIEALISDQETELTFYHWETPFPANTMSAEYARVMARQYGREPREITLHSRRLDNILSERLPPDQIISFMSIDAEGHDLNVLRSNDWNLFRPELVLVEDYNLTLDDLNNSAIFRFMRSIDYEMHAWLRPTVVYRQLGLKDWQDLVVAGLDRSTNHISEMD